MWSSSSSPAASRRTCGSSFRRVRRESGGARCGPACPAFSPPSRSPTSPSSSASRYGPGPLNVAIIAEYDALPEVGHACGHNVIAASAIGAGIALAAVADELGMRVSVIGTPAEEGGGGKIVMIEKGVFDDVHCALM